MRRGAGAAGGAAATTGAAAAGAATCATDGAAEGADAGRAATTGGRFAGGATVTAGRGGGALRAAVSACLRSKIAFSASPGFETCERSNLGLVSAGATRAALVRPPRLK